MDFDNKLKPKKTMDYRGLSGEKARKQAMEDFSGYGEELDKKVFKEGSIGHKRALSGNQKARDFLAAYNPKMYGGKK
jgi:hypothetical protein